MCPEFWKRLYLGDLSLLKATPLTNFVLARYQASQNTNSDSKCSQLTTALCNTALNGRELSCADSKQVRVRNDIYSRSRVYHHKKDTNKTTDL